MKEKKPFQFKLETNPIMHIGSFLFSILFSYFLFPTNLSSIGSLFGMLITNFFSVHLVSNVMRYFKGE
jgi:hypothetical protein